jgi:hypothetical protein
MEAKDEYGPPEAAQKAPKHNADTSMPSNDMDDTIHKSHHGLGAATGQSEGPEHPSSSAQLPETMLPLSSANLQKKRTPTIIDVRSHPGDIKLYEAMKELRKTLTGPALRAAVFDLVGRTPENELAAGIVFMVGLVVKLEKDGNLPDEDENEEEGETEIIGKKEYLKAREAYLLDEEIWKGQEDQV